MTVEVENKVSKLPASLSLKTEPKRAKKKNMDIIPTPFKSNT